MGDDLSKRSPTPDFPTCLREPLEEQYESLKETKDHYGFTWKGTLLEAQRTLESQPSDEEWGPPDSVHVPLSLPSMGGAGQR
ncbi:hypothetical protein [Salinigranum halophilum]|uniref:hypothetical protein n=1 Tax=Salinigranum halophilum TaxID=2565931 RepID=UPI0010A77382|nr:hypothetical protein [Salinigranum halophilum]